MSIQLKLSSLDAVLDDVEETPLENIVERYKDILVALHVLDLRSIDCEKKGNDHYLKMRVRNAFQNMMTLSMNQVIHIADELSSFSSKFSGEEIIEEYFVAKREIRLEMIVLLEDELNVVVDNLVKNNPRYQMGVELRQKDQDDVLQYVVDDIKQGYYQDQLSKFFLTKNPKQAINQFIDKCVEYGSFFVALSESHSKSLQKTVKTREDRMLLFLLIRRILMYYPKGGLEQWSQIIEYQFQDVVMHLVYGSDMSAILSSLSQTLKDFFHLSVAPFWKSELDRILELCVLCLWGMQYTVKNNVKWMFGEYFESMKDKGDDVLVHISDDLWKVIVLKQPCLQEEGFYGDYQGRFSLQDMRIWNRVDILANTYYDWTATKKELKKLSHHKDFFRRKYNNYLCDFYMTKAIVDQKIIGLHLSVIQDFEKMKRIYHERNEMVIKEYPVNQIKGKITLLDEGKKSLDALEKVINSIHSV